MCRSQPASKRSSVTVGGSHGQVFVISRPDDALKAAQVASLKEQREEEALKATIKREDEAAKKREAELDALTKKKDAAEKKQFKKGQADLEKELGF
jgi:microcompartment protein CcmL/EutN